MAAPHATPPATTTAPRTAPARPAPPGATTRRVTAVALVTSAATTALLAFFAARPDVDPLQDDGVLGQLLLPGRALTWALLAVAVLGTVTAGALVARRDRPLPRGAGRLVTAVGTVQVVGFGFLAQGSGTLSVAGYLLSMVVPVLAVVVAVQVFRTHPAWRVPLVLGAVLAVVGIVVARDAFASWFGNVTAALWREHWPILGVLLTLATASAWAGLLAVRAWEAGSLRRATAWVTRHRRLFTILAAMGPLPYALVRLTWLTPWPQGGGEGFDLIVRIQGVALSTGAWLGFVLTLGLILPWGERFPRWFPGLAGRPVPPAAAIVPGAAVAVMLCGAAIPLLGLIGPIGALLFPAWFWGPMLALAVWGYAGHRAGAR